MKVSLATFLACIGFGASSIAADRSSASTPVRERVLMDFGWRFTHGDPQDALISTVRADATPGIDSSGDTGASAAELANKSGDVASQTTFPSIFDDPEPGSLDKTKLADRAKRAAINAARPDPVAIQLGASISYVQPAYNDAAWRSLDLPHDWVVELPFGSGDAAAANIAHGRKAMDSKSGTNIGWYRHHFDLPASDKGRRLSLEFDGIYRNSLVWLNGHCLGRHNSGYIGFSRDISDLANYGGKNTLVVRADATRGEGWFYEGAGIYRHVWLVKTGPVHVARWGTFVTTEVKGAKSEVTLRTTVANDSESTAIIGLATTLRDADGKTVATQFTEDHSIPPHARIEIVQTLALSAARHWSPEQPYLYQAVSEVRLGKRVVDHTTTTFGIRTFAFDSERGFFLNGQPYKIKGTCNHQDHAGVGTALPDRLQEFRIGKLKEMGSNAYRPAHNPPTPELLDACDRLGMLVLDENRRFDDTPEVLGQLESLIRRDRNHPSVFMWCLANEEMDLQRNEREGVHIARTMQELANRLDPTRLTTIANNGAWKGWRQGFNKIVQVAGVNYFNHEEKNLDLYHSQRPDQPILGTEEASTLTTRGEYFRNDKLGYLPAYDTSFPKWGTSAETWWTYYAARSWLPGGFVWTGFDYRGEPTPFNHNYSSQFGILDTCGFPKDLFYYYQSWWSNKTTLHIFPHWNWAGKEGQEISVWAFSNCDEVELFLNDRSLGRQKMTANSHLEWKVKYTPGHLSAKGYKAGKPVAWKQVETTGAPAAVRLTPDRTIINADGQDVSVVTVAIVDDKGRIVPTADNAVEFTVKGGTLIGVGNGNPNSTESDKKPRRKAFNGLAQVILQSGRTPGRIDLTAISPGLASGDVVVQTAKIVQP
jgi:beta-galactosidase